MLLFSWVPGPHPDQVWDSLSGTQWNTGTRSPRGVALQMSEFQLDSCSKLLFYKRPGPAWESREDQIGSPTPFHLRKSRVSTPGREAQLCHILSWVLTTWLLSLGTVHCFIQQIIAKQLCISEWECECEQQFIFSRFFFCLFVLNVLSEKWYRRACSGKQQSFAWMLPLPSSCFDLFRFNSSGCYLLICYIPLFLELGVLDNVFLIPTMKNEDLAHPMSSTLISHLPPSSQYLIITITLLLLKIIILIMICFLLTSSHMKGSLRWLLRKRGNLFQEKRLAYVFFPTSLKVLRVSIACGSSLWSWILDFWLSLDLSFAS